MLLYRPSAPAPTTVRVQITAADIANGYSIASACPIALAIRRAGISRAPLVYEREASGVKVWMVRLGTSTPPIRLPVEAGFFARGFDAGKAVRPFHFELELPA